MNQSRFYLTFMFVLLSIGELVAQKRFRGGGDSFPLFGGDDLLESLLYAVGCAFLAYIFFKLSSDKSPGIFSFLMMISAGACLVFLAPLLQWVVVIMGGIFTLVVAGFIIFCVITFFWSSGKKKG